MLKKSITYETYSGERITEDFYFNLTKAELVELEMGHKGGLSEALKKIVESEDGKAIISEFKNIILKSYGVKSEDGRHFVKNNQLRQEFESTEAYSVLFMELVTDAEAAAEFVRMVIPREVTDGGQLALVPQEPPKPEPIKLTLSQIREMDADELQSGLAAGRYVL